MIDLRSDTVTKPTPGMLNAMLNAKVGDDVFEDDPTVNALEDKAAKMFGMEAALFCPSGTMTNQIALKVLTQPMDEIICHRLSHIYNYEGGGIAFNSGISARLIEGNNGLLKASDVLVNINEEDVHKPVTKLVALENTCNKGGGCFYSFKDILEIKAACDNNNLKLHLDGARLFNALVETSESTVDYGNTFDTISICMSKGLGCPVGSILLGSKDHIKYARRVRKVFGGGMRQAGYLAAACIYALDNHINRLKDDHKRAKIIAAELSNMNYIEEVLPTDTNIIIFKLNEQYSNNELLERLKSKGVLAVPMSLKTMRFVTHLGISDNNVDEIISALKLLN